MSRKSERNARASTGAASRSPDIDHTSGYKKSKRTQPRLEQSSNAYTESPPPKVSSPSFEGTHVSRSTSSGDDADGDMSNADTAEPDEDSDEDGERDAFAPSGPIEEHGDQAGRINRDSFDRESALEGNSNHGPTAFMGKSNNIEEKLTVRDSDDDVYNRVDLISDSEEDEPNLEQLEEKNIIDSEDADALDTAPAYLEASDGWEGFELEDGLLLEDVPFFDEQYGPTDSKVLSSEMELFQSESIFDRFQWPAPPLPSPSRRVRFKEPIAQLSNDSDMDSDNGDINDLFSPNATGALPSGRDMDFDGPYSEYEEDDGSSVGSSSGYENDYGDTTDEEDVPASATKRPQALLRQPSLSSLELDAQVPATPVAKRTFRLPDSLVGYRRGPRMGTWIINVAKPCAVVNSIGDYIIIHPAMRPLKSNDMSMSVANSGTSTANISPTSSQPKSATVPDNSSVGPSSGFSSQASMYDPVLGPGSEIAAASVPLPTRHSRQPSADDSFANPSVFLPMDAMENVSCFFDDDELNDEDDEDDDDALLNINDFIDFGDDSSEDGDQLADEDSSVTSPVTAEGSDPVQGKLPSSGASDDLLKHLDKHLVSAFRRGQSHPQPQSLRHHGNLPLDSYALKGPAQAVAAQMGSHQKRKMSETFNDRPSFDVAATKRMKVHH